MNKQFVVIGGQSDCFDSPISVVIESPSEFSSIRLFELDSKTLVPCQWEYVENGVLLTWIEPELKRLTAKKYEATFSQEPVESIEGITFFFMASLDQCACGQKLEGQFIRKPDRTL